VTCTTNNFSVFGLFGEPEVYNLTYTAGSNGSVSGDTEQEVEAGESGSAVTATPNSGYRFSGWSDGSHENPRIDEDVSEDITVTANFELSSSSPSGGMIMKKTSKIASPFEDTLGHWAELYIADLYGKKIISGYDAKHFYPDNFISRAEFMKMIVLAVNYDLVKNIEKTSFSDIHLNEWSTPYIETAKLNGIIDGNFDGTFSPWRNITRAEAIKVLVKTKTRSEIQKYDDIFEDIKPYDWFSPYVIYAYNKGIVHGNPDKLFKPNNQMTRAEAAKIISLLN